MPKSRTTEKLMKRQQNAPETRWSRGSRRVLFLALWLILPGCGGGGDDGGAADVLRDGSEPADGPALQDASVAPEGGLDLLPGDGGASLDGEEIGRAHV